jgi:hypothetical protein
MRSKKEQALIDAVLIRLGAADGDYTFVMEDMYLQYENDIAQEKRRSGGKISLIKLLRQYFNDGLKHSKDCTEGNYMLQGYLRGYEARDLLEALKPYKLRNFKLEKIKIRKTGETI